MKQILFLFALLLAVAVAANPEKAAQLFQDHLAALEAKVSSAENNVTTTAHAAGAGVTAAGASVASLGSHVNLSFLAGRAFAADNTCQNIYGGGGPTNCPTNGTLAIDKTIQNPQTQAFVDNLGVNDPRFSPNQAVVFRITVKNTSSNTVKNIKIKDILPDFVEYVSGTGSYDKGNKTLSIDISQLAKNETKSVDITAKVMPSNQLAQQGISCVVNQAIAAANNKNTQDNAQFCIQAQQASPTPAQTKGGFPTYPSTAPTTKGGLPVYTQPSGSSTPATGPEALGLLALIPAGLGGLILRKKTA